MLTIWTNTTNFDTCIIRMLMK